MLFPPGTASGSNAESTLPGLGPDERTPDFMIRVGTYRVAQISTPALKPSTRPMLNAIAAIPIAINKMKIPS